MWHLQLLIGSRNGRTCHFSHNYVKAQINMKKFKIFYQPYGVDSPAHLDSKISPRKSIHVSKHFLRNPKTSGISIHQVTKKNPRLVPIDLSWVYKKFAWYFIVLRRKITRVISDINFRICILPNYISIFRKHIIYCVKFCKWQPWQI